MAANGIIGPGIFEDLQKKIDEDTKIKDTLREIVQTLEKHDRATQATLSKIHSTPSKDLPAVLNTACESLKKSEETIKTLSNVASQYPYYKYNYSWTREMQGTVFSTLLTGYLGGLPATQPNQLLTLEEVGARLNIPVNLKDRDAFHLTIEEYLQALISLLDELARLARNSVTLGDYQRPQQIAKFIKDVHAGFQILNLKNDSLRKRSDGVKYRVKEVEDVVYDLSLRGLLPKDPE